MRLFYPRDYFIFPFILHSFTSDDYTAGLPPHPAAADRSHLSYARDVAARRSTHTVNESQLHNCADEFY